VGRRADAYLDGNRRRGGPVPYVGADYATATAALARRAADLGHRKMAYVGHGAGAESAVDRMTGFRSVAPDGRPYTVAGRNAVELLDAIRSAGVSVAYCEDLADAAALDRAARGRGLSVPGDLSLVALGDPTRPTATDREFTGFRIPRREMGWQAVEVLTDILHGPGARVQRLLPCELVE